DILVDVQPAKTANHFESTPRAILRIEDLRRLHAGVSRLFARQYDRCGDLPAFMARNQAARPVLELLLRDDVFAEKSDIIPIPVRLRSQSKVLAACPGIGAVGEDRLLTFR